jgi:hypothetical protein
VIALHLLAAVGAALIVARGTLFRSLRRLWPALLACCQCVGFWTGVAFESVWAVSEHSAWHAAVVDAVSVGLATSLLAMLADGILIKLLGDPNQTLKP